MSLCVIAQIISGFLGQCLADQLTSVPCRLCPGRWIAIETIWLTVATVLFAFDISKARDESGKILEPDTQYTPAMLRYATAPLTRLSGGQLTLHDSRPKPFQCVVTERSSLAASLVRQTE